ncbi:MAG: DUF3034 family protein [Burkholderiales bacterium]|nr:DUF3034 family protein [Burkholderiales bacterium]MBH2017430.1 DUF3034 family protein [Burkholderiales bacterium]
MACITLASACAVPPAWAGDRLLATSGVSQVEGAAGGGLAPWAVIAGLGSSDQPGASAYATHIRTQGGYNLNIQGAAVGVNNRVELSMARWSFKFSDTVPGETARINIVGAKVRVLGDALYDQDRWWPQVSVGVQHKDNEDFGTVPKLLGAVRGADTDYYISATKVWLGAAWGRNVLANLTLRATRANQFGILGFGGDKDDSRSVLPEASVAVLLRDDLALGAEWRVKPDKLQAFREDNAYDVFLAWFPHRHLSLTAAWLELGNIANKASQRSLYLSAQVAF